MHERGTIAKDGECGKMSVGKNIKKYRKEKKMTQKELATLVGVNEVTIRSYEAEKYRPKIETIQKIAKALDVPVYILDGRFKHMTNHEKLSQISGSTDLVDVAAVKSLLTKIQDDYEKGMFEQNSGQYITFYKSMKEWLESEAEE